MYSKRLQFLVGAKVRTTFKLFELRVDSGMSLMNRWEKFVENEVGNFVFYDSRFNFCIVKRRIIVNNLVTQSCDADISTGAGIEVSPVVD